MHTRVEPALFYLVFGESVLNDAVSLTIFNISSKFVGGKHGAGVSHSQPLHSHTVLT
jgi:NhaP-type Na+/H+ or K+/H+ antiporter